MWGLRYFYYTTPSELKKIVIDNNRTFLVENLDPEDVIMWWE